MVIAKGNPCVMSIALAACLPLESFQSLPAVAEACYRICVDSFNTRGGPDNDMDFADIENSKYKDFSDTGSRAAV